MKNGKPEKSTRLEKRQRYQAKKPRKKMDRLLNILIAIVSILIVLNLVSIFTGDDEKQNTKETKQITEENKKTEESKEVTTNISDVEDQSNGDHSTEQMSNTETLESELIVQTSADPVVDEVLVDPNWQATPTKQTGEHVSAYEEGHIDYEEKKETFRNAVGLGEDEIIFWSVKNNGNANSSVAVVSSNDSNRSNKYRVYIEWIDNEGWKPVKVEKLNQLADSY
ncbi:uncharacterized protein DUF1510 [Ureibacillus xyleni]|uniref:Uncharacterized protein DUF1510 n=1 Tax=Ureibacillus xyleni TaxID=614648 RepID=A0A285TEJ7_9BACL|nr:YrrS family protein [Ureibacillus xyleni]SOC20674.1 uncharacterized protein DUF1510 [Ureibacillus xyleni]